MIFESAFNRGLDSEEVILFLLNYGLDVNYVCINSENLVDIIYRGFKSEETKRKSYLLLLEHGFNIKLIR